MMFGITGGLYFLRNKTHHNFDPYSFPYSFHLLKRMTLRVKLKLYTAFREFTLPMFSEKVKATVRHPAVG